MPPADTDSAPVLDYARHTAAAPRHGWRIGIAGFCAGIATLVNLGFVLNWGVLAYALANPGEIYAVGPALASLMFGGSALPVGLLGFGLMPPVAAVTDSGTARSTTVIRWFLSGNILLNIIGGAALLVVLNR